MNLLKPSKLLRGDKVATVSLAGGSAGNKEMLWRYEVAKSRLKEIFKLQVVPMANSMKGSKFIYNNPKARADDFMQAFSDKSIKAIFLNLGGDDGIRILPYIDFEIIKKNPKIFIGFSDATVFHFMCFRAGFTSFYGPNALTTLSENVCLHDYTVKWIERALFRDTPIGNIEPAEFWTSESIDWSLPSDKIEKRKVTINNGYETLQGIGKIQGRLIGGCIEPLTFEVKGTEIFPPLEKWRNSIIFLEAVPIHIKPLLLKHMLRGLAAIGVFREANGVVFGKPIDHLYYDEYKQVLLQVLRDEEGLADLPILYNLNFGHTAPTTILPYGTMAEIDCDNKKFTILESGVV